MSGSQTTHDHEGKVIEGHVYDDIQELDNPLPRWWLFTFYGTIVFSILYYGYYQLGTGPTLNEELRQDLSVIQESQKAIPVAPIPGSEDLMALLGRPEVLSAGKEIYQARCLACHGPKGEGLVGPNLTDKYWIHGKGQMQDLVQITTAGVAEKGMPSWSPLLSREAIQSVSAFVYTFRQNPVPGKAPQGALVEGEGAVN